MPKWLFFHFYFPPLIFGTYIITQNLKISNLLTFGKKKGIIKVYVNKKIRGEKNGYRR